MSDLMRTISRFLRYILEALLTAFFWAVFGFICTAGVFAVVRGEIDGPQAPFLPRELVLSIGSVVGYGVLMLIAAVLLIAWAKYNQHRFAGVDRRKPPLPLSKAQLCHSFSITESQFDDVHEARIFIVHHDDHAVIRAVGVIDEKMSLGNIARDHYHLVDQDLVAQDIKQKMPQQAEQNTKQDIKNREWSFVELWPSVRYDQHDTWLSQRDSYDQSRLPVDAPPALCFLCRSIEKKCCL